MTARVSILIPVFNRSRYIGACIESALAQTFRDLEVIVVDNASTDDSWEICRRYAALDSRVRAFRNDTNIGPVRNWKRCAELARGQLAHILFSDDLLDADNLAETVPLLDDPEVGFVWTAVRVGAADDALARVRFAMPGLAGKCRSERYLAATLILGNTPTSPGCALFRTSDLAECMLEEIPSPSMSQFASTGAGVDLLIYLLVAKRYPWITHVPRPLTFFRDHSDAISRNKADLVRAQLTQARAWFCEQHMPARTERTVLAMSWLVELRLRRRWIPRTTLARRFSAVQTFTWADILRGIGVATALLARGMLAAMAR